MSTGGGKKGGGGGKKKTTSSEEPAKAPEPPIVESRGEDVSSNEGKKTASPEEATPPKPNSASVTTREGANKLLNLAMKSEWTGVEAVIKSLEKALANASEDANLVPLAGVMDFVSRFY